MRGLLCYLKRFYPRMGFGFLIKTVGTVMELMLPLILTHVLKNVVGKSVNEIIFWGIAMILCSFGCCALNIWANRIAAAVSRGFAEDMRKELFSKTLHLSAAQTDKFTIPSLESRITTDTYNVHGFINMMQRMGVRAPIMLLGGISITLIMDAYLSLVMIAMIPIIFLTVLFIRKKGVPLYMKVQKSVDNMIRVVREDAQGIRVIKALSKDKYEHKRYQGVNSTLIKDELRAGIIMGSVNPVMNVLINVGSVLVIAISAGRVSGHMSEPETVIAFMQYFTHISMSLMAVTRMFMMYTKSSASARRISEVLSEDEGIKVESKEKYPDIKSDAHIVFKDVTFSYNGKRNNASKISFELKAGEGIGIIGATGSGKSTLVKLLLRFYDVDEGAIYINGEDIRTIEKERLYKMFGVALQYDFLYSDTIEENIKFGRDISDEDMKNATEIAQARDFIENFPDGFSHLLSQHGTNISGGQKQRILISRAIAGNPEILILDDSSSALDYKTDALLRKALGEKMKNTTRVTVAQRVSSVKDSAVIIVLEDGKIIGMGTHRELMASCREYEEIATSQMGGAFVD